MYMCVCMCVCVCVKWYFQHCTMGKFIADAFLCSVMMCDNFSDSFSSFVVTMTLTKLKKKHHIIVLQKAINVCSVSQKKNNIAESLFNCL